MVANSLAVLLHIVGSHPGGIAVDYVSLAVVGVCLSVAFAYVVKAQPAPRTAARSARQRPARSMAVAPSSSTPSRSRANVALSLLGLSVLVVQGFHVIEHIVLVVQVEALGFGLAEAHGLLGSRVDFEWLHFSYNSAFLGALILMLVYGVRHRQELPAATGIPGMALAGAVGLQTYHVAEHVIRIVQYYQTGCTPCVGLIGRVVPFIWPHLFFGLIAYIPMVVCYFAYGMHRQLIEVVVSQIEGRARGSGRGDDEHDAASRGAGGSLSPAPLSPLHSHRNSSIAKGRSHHGR